jgi:phytoene dehydrogenase-like protein
MPIDPWWSWRGLRTYAAMLPAISVFRRYSRVPIKDLCARMKSPFLRRAFETLFPMPDAPVSGILMGLAGQTRKNAGYPVGGSLAFSQAMARRFLDLGGEIVYGARVSEVIVENDRALGARTEDAREARADYVVSAADGHTTLFRMLGGKYLTEQLRSFYEGGMETFPPLVQVSLGLKRRIEGASGIGFRLASPVEVGPNTHAQITVRNMSDDPTLAPPGCSVVIVMLESDYDWWAALRSDSSRYEAEKKRVADDVIARLDEKWPGLKADVEVVDIATPLTWERYTGNWRGAYEGWMITTRTMEKALGPGFPKELPGLAGFSMIGQWTTIGGGVPPAAKDGRDLVRRLCRRDGRRFVTTEA